MAVRAFLIPRGSSEHCFWAHAALQGSWLICSTAVQHFLADPGTPNSTLPSRSWNPKFNKFSANSITCSQIVFLSRKPCFSELQCLKCNWKVCCSFSTSSSFILCSTFAKSFPSETCVRTHVLGGDLIYFVLSLSRGFIDFNGIINADIVYMMKVYFLRQGLI